MSENTSTEVFDATAALSALLEDPEGATERNEAEQVEEAEGAEPEALDDDSDETPEQGDEPDTETEEESNEADADTSEEPDEDVLVTVKIDGKSEKVSLKELRDGYQRNTSFTQKSMALAEQRKAFEAEQETVRQLKAHYAHALDEVQQQIVAVPQLTSEQWEDLRINHPQHYLLARQELSDLAHRQAAVQQEQERLAHEAATEQAAEFHAHVASEREILFRKRPEWRDAKVFAKAVQDMRQFGLTVMEFSKEELDQAADHRAILALYDAMENHRLKKIKAEPVRSSTRNIQPGSSHATPRKPNAADEAIKRQSKSGSLSNTADALRHLL